MIHYYDTLVYIEALDRLCVHLNMYLVMIQVLVVVVLRRHVRRQNHNQFVHSCWSLTTGISRVLAAVLYNELPATWLFQFLFCFGSRALSFKRPLKSLSVDVCGYVGGYVAMWLCPRF